MTAAHSLAAALGIAASRAAGIFFLFSSRVKAEIDPLPGVH